MSFKCQRLQSSLACKRQLQGVGGGGDWASSVVRSGYCYSMICDLLVTVYINLKSENVHQMIAPWTRYRIYYFTK